MVLDNRHTLFSVTFWGLAFLVLFWFGGLNSAYGQAAPALTELKRNLDLLWVIAASAMVFFMQVGFTAFETGSVQAKNAIAVALKNLTVFILCSVFYFFCGFGLMFGETLGGIVGTNHFLFEGVAGVFLGYAFAFFQVVFAGTAATILTGAVAERTRLSAIIWSCILMICVIYPIFGHWVWGGYFHQGQAGWLARLGFIDFAGSTVVHSIGGWFALAGAIIVGPRTGKYNKDGTVNRMGGHNIPLAAIGTFFLWFGWFGFNGGSALKIDASVGMTIMNTNIAAGAGGAVCLLFGWLKNKRRFDVEAILLGTLGGLVAITAGSNRVEPWGALVIGVIAGCLVLLGKDFIEKVLKIDDPVGAVTVHGIGGAVGTVALALFAPFYTLPHDRLLQVGIQFLGVVTAFAWSFGLGLLAFWVGNKLMRLRVSPEEEQKGLNVAEYEDVTSWLNFARISKLEDLNVMLEKRIQERTHQLSLAKKYTDSIISSMKESLVVTDTRRIIKDVNPTLESLLGYKRQELLGKPVSLLADREEELFKEHTMQKLLNEGILHDYSINLLAKNGDPVPVLFTGSILKDDAGVPLGMVGIARDMRQTIQLIKTLQKANEELGTSNERFQTIMKSVRVPIATVDMRRDIVSVNSAFEGLTGWPQEEVPGRNYDVLLALAVGTKGFTIEEPDTWIGRAVITHRAGKQIDVSYTEAPLKDFNGNPVGVVCTMEDISKQAEIDRMKTEFISTVSHELRTPLTSIKGYVDLILEGDTGPISDTQKEFLQIVAQSGDRLTNLINDLLDVERIESGKIFFKKELVNVPPLIYQVLRTFQKEIEKKGLHLNTKFQKDTMVVEGDRERIEQVLANLVSNAIKYNRPTGCIGVWLRLENHLLRIDVEDSGVGISEENQRRLFEKFFRADTSLTREVGGTGLGLSIVKAIVERLGGTVQVKSKLGEGSTFTVLLPALDTETVYPENV
jgi:Amt family ammonium transporter